jgi:serine/threonine-protein kinase
MSVVYEAEHQRLGSTVALKVLAPELASDDMFRARFLKESRIAASLNHPNVIPIYDMGPCDELLFIAMRYVSGADLRAILKAQERITPAQALLLIGQAARALDAAHRHGLVHRDVKPANFLVERGADEDPDHVYLADFGISKHTLSRSGLTATGQFVGTIDYIAPEQIQDKPVDGRTDIYSLGCVLYECLTGRVPFQKHAEAAVIWAHVEEQPTPPTALCPDLPPAIDQAIAGALAKEPADRYDTCREFLAAVRSALDSHGSEEAASRRGPEQAPPTVLTREPVAQGPDSTALPAPGPAQQSEAHAAPPLRVSGTRRGFAEPQAQPPTDHLTIGRETPGVGAGRPPAGAPPLAGDGIESGDRGDREASASRRGGALLGGWRRLVALVVVLAVAGAVVGVVLAGGSSSSKNPVHSPLLRALATANESMTAKGLLPPSSCRAQSVSIVTCAQPSFAVENVTFKTFPSLSALYAAYVNTIKSLSGASIATNFGECTPETTNGELSWNHNYEHSRRFPLAELRAGMVSDEKAAGRLFCVFTNSQYHLVWTQNDGHLLAALSSPCNRTWRRHAHDEYPDVRRAYVVQASARI